MPATNLLRCLNDIFAYRGDQLNADVNIPESELHPSPPSPAPTDPICAIGDRCAEEVWQVGIMGMLFSHDVSLVQSSERAIRTSGASGAPTVPLSNGTSRYGDIAHLIIRHATVTEAGPSRSDLENVAEIRHIDITQAGIFFIEVDDFENAAVRISIRDHKECFATGAGP